MTPAPLPVLLVGRGPRGQAFRDVLTGADRFHVVDHLAHPPTSVESLAAVPPGLVVVAALPPRAGRRFADELESKGIPGLFEAPIAESKSAPPTTFVRIAHGWTTLPGLAWLSKVLATQVVDTLSLDLRGLPEAPEGDVDEALVHALALLRRLVPDAAPTRADAPSDGVLQAEFAANSKRVTLALRTHGHQLQVRFSGPQVEGSWQWRPDSESLHLRPLVARPTNDAFRREHETGSITRRLVAGLLDPARAALDTLADADDVRRRADAVLARLPKALPIGRRALVHARRLSDRHEPETRVLGLVRTTPLPAPAAPPERVVPPVPPGHLETFAFRAGLKPVCFLTSRPGTVDADLARFGPGVHVERRERRVLVGAQDEWKDDRTSGEPFVELYVSRDPALARRAMQLQADGDPTKSLAEIGALLGYPSCCVESFAGIGDRSNNTRNRYVIAARTRAKAPWPWELNDLPCMPVPFFPCRFDCPNALAWARGLFGEMRKDFPDETARLGTLLATPVLYFDHGRQLLLDGGRVTSESQGISLEFECLRAGPDAPAPFLDFAASLGDVRSLTLDADTLVFDGPAGPQRFDRTDPALGFVAPFGR